MVDENRSAASSAVVAAVATTNLDPSLVICLTTTSAPLPRRPASIGVRTRTSSPSASSNVALKRTDVSVHHRVTSAAATSNSSVEPARKRTPIVSSAERLISSGISPVNRLNPLCVLAGSEVTSATSHRRTAPAGDTTGAAAAMMSPPFDARSRACDATSTSASLCARRSAPASLKWIGSPSA